MNPAAAVARWAGMIGAVLFLTLGVGVVFFVLLGKPVDQMAGGKEYVVRFSTGELVLMELLRVGVLSLLVYTGGRVVAATRFANRQPQSLVGDAARWARIVSITAVAMAVVLSVPFRYFRLHARVEITKWFVAYVAGFSALQSALFGLVGLAFLSYLLHSVAWIIATVKPESSTTAAFASEEGATRSRQLSSWQAAGIAVALLLGLYVGNFLAGPLFFALNRIGER